MEFDGLAASGNFVEVNGIPEVCNIVSAKLLYNWKGD